MKTKYVLRSCMLSAAAVYTMTACTTLTVTSDVNAGTSAAQCHSYAWAGEFHPKNDGPLRDVVNPVNESRLRGAISASLNAKGLQMAANRTDADCLVGYGIGAQNVIEGAYPYGWGFGGGWGFRHGWAGANWGGPYVYRQGIIAVDLYDAKGKQPIWHASVDQDVTGLTGAAAESKINAAVTAIFTKYPS